MNKLEGLQFCTTIPFKITNAIIKEDQLEIYSIVQMCCWTNPSQTRKALTAYKHRKKRTFDHKINTYMYKLIVHTLDKRADFITQSDELSLLLRRIHRF